MMKFAAGKEGDPDGIVKFTCKNVEIWGVDIL